MYCCNFPLPYIFAKWQVIYRTQKTEFDLQPTSLIYTQFKSCAIDETEGLQIKILITINITAIIADIMWFWILKQVLYHFVKR